MSLKGLALMHAVMQQRRLQNLELLGIRPEEEVNVVAEAIEDPPMLPCHTHHFVAPTQCHTEGPSSRDWLLFVMAIGVTGALVTAIGMLVVLLLIATGILQPGGSDVSPAVTPLP